MRRAVRRSGSIHRTARATHVFHTQHTDTPSSRIQVGRSHGPFQPTTLHTGDQRTTSDVLGDLVTPRVRGRERGEGVEGGGGGTRCGELLSVVLQKVGDEEEEEDVLIQAQLKERLRETKVSLLGLWLHGEWGNRACASDFTHDSVKMRRRGCTASPATAPAPSSLVGV